MADFYIINNKDPLDLLFKLKQQDSKNTYHFVGLDDPKSISKLIQEVYQNNKEKEQEKNLEDAKEVVEARYQICKELITIFQDRHNQTIEEIARKIVNAMHNTDTEYELDKIEREKLALEEEDNQLNIQICKYYEFINNKLFEANKLSDTEIIKLCNDLYEEVVLKDSKIAKSFPKKPNVKIIKLNENDKHLPLQRRLESSYTHAFNICHWAASNCQYNIYCQLEHETDIDFFLRTISLNRTTVGGIITDNSHDEYFTIFYSLMNKNKIREDSRNFINLYLKSLDVLAIYFQRKDNCYYVVKKPDELKLNKEKRELYFRYDSEEYFYKNKVKLPIWLYKTKAEDLNITDYFLLKNAEEKSVFIEKLGIDRLMQYGTIIDSYENYPENKMWAKSEYKIIDMHAIIPPRKHINYRNGTAHFSKPFKYAPFLYMKNQTTGAYHLEGLHPRCKTLYDAIKMRYNGLNIKDYDIKDIK